MNALDNISRRATGLQRPASTNFRNPAVFKVTDTIVEPHGHGGSLLDGHELRLELLVTYWANCAQQPQARQVAERTLADLLYRDVLALVSKIEHAASDGDSDAAVSACGELRTLVTR